MRCSKAKSLFSANLDGAVAGTQMHALEQHLSGCGVCREACGGLRQTQQLLAQSGRRESPGDLPLRLRVAISREIARSHHPAMEYLWLRLDHAARVFLVPATAGLITAVFIFGVFLGFSALPLQAGNPDVPLIAETAPQLEQSAFANAMTSVNDDSLVIEAYVDSKGRVDDYRILSDSREEKILTPQVKNMLLDLVTFTTFRPATSMGRAIPGRAILSFSKVNVKG